MYLRSILMSPVPYRSQSRRREMITLAEWSTSPCHICMSLVLRMEKAMAPHSSALAWKISWMEEPGGLRSMGLLRVGHDWATSLSLFTFTHWRRKWQPTPVFLPWKIPGTGEPGGLPSMGLHRVGHDWSDLAAAAAVLHEGVKISDLDHTVVVNQPSFKENNFLCMVIF